VVLSIAEQLGVPIRGVGLGEGTEDLYDFEAAAFVEALFSAEDS
jgi:fused signal recognition particle receptor